MSLPRISDADRLLRRRVRAITMKAVYNGRLPRPAVCSQCGGPRPQAHHADYSKPLDVLWLCLKCHRRTHRRHTGINDPTGIRHLIRQLRPLA